VFTFLHRSHKNIPRNAFCSLEKAAAIKAHIYIAVLFALSASMKREILPYAHYDPKFLLLTALHLSLSIGELLYYEDLFFLPRRAHEKDDVFHGR
jgi:hypothetical protein